MSNVQRRTWRVTVGVVLLAAISFGLAWTGQVILALSTLALLVPTSLLSVHIPKPLEGSPAKLDISQFRLLLGLAVTITVILTVSAAGVARMLAGS